MYILIYHDYLGNEEVIGRFQDLLPLPDLASLSHILSFLCVSSSPIPQTCSWWQSSDLHQAAVPPSGLADRTDRSSSSNTRLHNDQSPLAFDLWKPLWNLECHQNVIKCSLAHHQPFLNISCQRFQSCSEQWHEQTPPLAFDICSIHRRTRSSFVAWKLSSIFGILLFSNKYVKNGSDEFSE